MGPVASTDDGVRMFQLYTRRHGDSVDPAQLRRWVHANAADLFRFYSTLGADSCATPSGVDKLRYDCFFHRCFFAMAANERHPTTLDGAGLEAMLSIMYAGDSVFTKDEKLPALDQLRENLVARSLERRVAAGQLTAGVEISFADVQPVLTGNYTKPRFIRRVAVVGSKLADEGSRVLYEVHVEWSSGEIWSCLRPYAEFRNLRDQIRGSAAVRDAGFPQQQGSMVQGLTDQVREERTDGLNRFLQAVCGDAVARVQPPYVRFCSNRAGDAPWHGQWVGCSIAQRPPCRPPSPPPSLPDRTEGTERLLPPLSSQRPPDPAPAAQPPPPPTASAPVFPPPLLPSVLPPAGAPSPGVATPPVPTLLAPAPPTSARPPTVATPLPSAPTAPPAAAAAPPTGALSPAVATSPPARPLTPPIRASPPIFATPPPARPLTPPASAPPPAVGAPLVRGLAVPPATAPPLARSGSFDAHSVMRSPLPSLEVLVDFLREHPGADEEILAGVCLLTPDPTLIRELYRLRTQGRCH
eukprot:TRINITY_DN47980_c0_g1_i1.p1 TRINITY_DN47980_c0_g1~~TRINITY_DN47980_c0_g1_i1.p1  ORF type:complete len:525 (+),score=68.00 TRINITY_DN47980_c0_g1_i1:57-1631(+)